MCSLPGLGYPLLEEPRTLDVAPVRARLLSIELSLAERQTALGYLAYAAALASWGCEVGAFSPGTSGASLLVMI